MFRNVFALLGVGIVVCIAPLCFSGELINAVDGRSGPASTVAVFSMTACCSHSAWPAAEEALVEELEGVQLTVALVPGVPISKPMMRETLRAVAHYNNAAIVIRLQKESASSYHVNILSTRVDGTDELRHLNFQFGKHPDKYPDQLQTAVLRIVETVRILMSRKYMVAPKPASTAASTAPKPGNQKVGIGFGIASTYSPGGVSPSLGLGTTIHVQPITALLVAFNFTWALYTKDVSTAGESATFDMTIARGSLYWNILPESRIHPALGLSIGALVAKSAGKSAATDTSVNINDKRIVAYLGASGRLAFDMGPYTAFFLDIKGGILAPRVNIFFQEQRAATYGRPLLEAFGGFEFRFV